MKNVISKNKKSFRWNKQKAIHKTPFKPFNDKIEQTGYSQHAETNQLICNITQLTYWENCLKLRNMLQLKNGRQGEAKRPHTVWYIRPCGLQRSN